MHADNILHKNNHLTRYINNSKQDQVILSFKTV